MAIDFHAPENQNTYAGREAHRDWAQAIGEIVDPVGKRVVDVGCGGGIYTAAWALQGAAQVIGVDFSAQMVRDATEANRGTPNISIRQGDALHTGLPDGSADIVFERALIHHLGDHSACLREAWRVLSPGGHCIIQDRTPDDIALPGSPEHIRGYFFDVFPGLLAVEIGRRPVRKDIELALLGAGFGQVNSRTLWETRKLHPDASALAADLRARTGRSILHELSDTELEQLVLHVLRMAPATGPVREADRWTLWTAIKPA